MSPLITYLLISEGTKYFSNKGRYTRLLRTLAFHESKWLFHFNKRTWSQLSIWLALIVWINISVCFFSRRKIAKNQLLQVSTNSSRHAPVFLALKRIPVLLKVLESPARGLYRAAPLLIIWYTLAEKLLSSCVPRPSKERRTARRYCGLNGWKIVQTAVPHNFDVT